MKSAILITFFSCLVYLSLGQDAHFSQSELNASARNPAMMGIMSSDHKLTASYRSQWASIPSAYRNILLAYEKKGNKFSWGTQLLQNDAGKVSLKTTQLMINLAYRKKLSARGEFLSIGASGGVIQQKFDPSLFSFDNQYIAETGFDPGAANKETFLNTTQFLPSATVGIMVSKYFNKIKGSGGLSFAHLNEPSSQFYETLHEKYSMRTSLFANAQLPIKEQLKAEIHLSWNKQSVATEKIIGAKLKYHLNAENKLTGGIANRLQDAWIIEGGITFSASALTISYDMNNSPLNVATNSQGGWEVTFSYLFNKNKKTNAINANFERLNEKPYKDLVTSKIPDSDLDGIPDKIDACPNLYGEKENSGCPVNTKDSDFDGLLDHVDSCPFLKGSAAMGGCPDSDKDGISDLKDYCPFLKGEASNNGCPVMSKTDHQQFLKTNAIKVVVEFATDKSDIKVIYYQDLNDVVDFLLENQTAKAFITGHTDDEGDQAYNFKLGERRATNVMEFFLSRGVSFQQLSIVSYGETKPTRQNRSAYEKAKNRRVEVQVYAE